MKRLEKVWELQTKREEKRRAVDLGTITRVSLKIKPKLIKLFDKNAYVRTMTTVLE